MFEKMLSYANHLGLYAEEVGDTGEALGNYPQAFTHLGPDLGRLGPQQGARRERAERGAAVSAGVRVARQAPGAAHDRREQDDHQEQGHQREREGHDRQDREATSSPSDRSGLPNPAVVAVDAGPQRGAPAVQ